MDFLGGTVDRNPLENARNMGLIPGPGRFAVEQLSPCATTIKPQR